MLTGSNLPFKSPLHFIGLHVDMTMYMNMVIWSRMAAKNGDPSQGQVQSA